MTFEACEGFRSITGDKIGYQQLLPFIGFEGGFHT